MQEFDRLPAELRQWLSTAILPWRARSVQRAYDKAYARTGNAQKALAELDALQARRVARDAQVIWDGDHPQIAAVAG